MKHKIILDCDPGHDDAIALLLAAHHPNIDLLAVTTVAGNQSAEKTAYNALKICTGTDSQRPDRHGYVTSPLVPCPPSRQYPRRVRIGWTGPP